jgi:hypothetical protein
MGKFRTATTADQLRSFAHKALVEDLPDALLYFGFGVGSSIVAWLDSDDDENVW